MDERKGSVGTAGARAARRGRALVAALAGLGAALAAACTGPAPGLVCGANDVCEVAPYAGCDQATLGLPCATGRDDADAAVPTSCRRPMIANAGPHGWCTATCTGQASQCPAAPVAGRTRGCHVLEGAASGQCFVECAGGASCPVNTVCARVPTSAGTRVEICVPRPAD